jgi:hypothetical protein
MKRMLCGSVLVLAVAVLIGPAAAQQGQDEEAMMKAYMEAAAPGAPHQLLAQLAGSWKTTSKSWQMPGAPPIESTGTAETKMVMGGRYLQETMDSTMMGMPFQGMGLLGYDNLRQEYSGVWLDNMSTQLMPYSGQYDPARKTFTMKGDFLDAVSGQIMTARMVTTVISEKEHHLEMFMPGPDGKEFKGMEMIYVRK